MSIIDHGEVHHRAHEREDLCRGEDAPECDHASGLRNPVEIVANTDHCGEEEEHDGDVTYAR